MARSHCTGAGFLDALRSAVANLEANVDEINALNVFPVPDGDTGTNMLATVRAALEEAEAVGRDAPVERIAAAVSHGALMGARGNSGVITSQILRGVAEGLAGKRRFTGLDLANALTLGTQTAYGAVGKPVEGTILTVIREAAAAAVEAAEQDEAMEHVLAATVEGARKSVARTPSLLPILREAGVVDSGGQGLFRLFEGALLSVQGRPVHAAVAPRGRSACRGPPRAAPAFRAGVAALEEDAFGYETVFIVTALPAGALDVPAIQAHLESIGNSVLVGGDARMAKVHVHNERPDEVIAYGLSLGDADPDHDREPRHDGRRRPRGAGRRVRRRGRRRRRRSRRIGRAHEVRDRGGREDGEARRPDARGRWRRPAGDVGEWRARPGRGGGRPEPRAGGRGSRCRRGSRAGVPRSRRRPRPPWRADGEPEHRRAAADRPPRAVARGDPPARTTRTSASPPSRRPGSARTAASSSSRPATRPRGSRRCSPSTRISTRPRTSSR